MSNWATGLAGGVLIGTSATLLLWLNGRIAGISGILNGVLEPGAPDRAWRGWFLAGLLGGAGAWIHATGVAYYAADTFSPWTMLVAGALVGAGTRLGGGCTSGHGVCGLGRLSVRSLVATLTFMGTAMVTVYLTRHLAGS